MGENEKIKEDPLNESEFDRARREAWFAREKSKSGFISKR